MTRFRGIASAAQAREAIAVGVALTPKNLFDIGVLSGLLFGMTLSNNAGDATNDIDFAAGACADSTGVRMLVGGAMTKQLDAAWAAGNAAGGRMSAAAIANTTYHCFAIYKDSDGSVDYGFDVSATAPTMPSGYTYFRRIGSIIRLSNAIVAFIQVGDKFMRSIPVGSVAATNPGTSAISATMNVPAGVVVEAIVVATITDATPAGNTCLLLTALSQADSTPDNTLHTLRLRNNAVGTVEIGQSTEARVMTNTSRQIRYRLDASEADITVTIITHGWVDTRGRLG